MLRSVKDLQDYAIHATDGNIGHVKDLYFDDQAWVIRYLIVDTGTWLSSRKVLISPISIGQPNWSDRVLPVSITKQQVKNSPNIDTEKPVSRQHEIGYLSYYGYQNYWGGGEDPHLRSCNEVTGYHVEATDGEIGQVQGLLVDEETWAIRYLVVDTNNWWPGQWVLVAPQWIKAMSWPDTTVSLDLTRQEVKNAPEYDSTREPERTQQLGVYRHNGRPVQWVAEAKATGKREPAILPR